MQEVEQRRSSCRGNRTTEDLSQAIVIVRLEVADQQALTVEMAADAEGKAEIAKHAKDAGRDPDRIDINLFAPTGMFRTKSELAEVAKAGADNALLWLTGNDEKEILAELEDIAGALF